MRRCFNMTLLRKPHSLWKVKELDSITIIWIVGFNIKITSDCKWPWWQGDRFKKAREICKECTHSDWMGLKIQRPVDDDYRSLRPELPNWRSHSEKNDAISFVLNNLAPMASLTSNPVPPPLQSLRGQWKNSKLGSVIYLQAAESSVVNQVSVHAKISVPEAQT